MTISSQITKITAAGNDSATTFSFSPIVLVEPATGEDHDLEVTLTDSLGVETVITEGTGASNYSVTVADYPGTGSITYPASGGGTLPTGTSITIKRQLDLVQTLDLENQGGYFPDLQEQQFDKLVMMMQQQQEEIDRCLKVLVSEAADLENLPNVAARANKTLGFDASGDPIAVGAATTPFAESLLDDPDAATARATLAITPANVGAKAVTEVEVVSSANYTVDETTDNFKLITVSTGSFNRTVSLPAAADAGAGFQLTISCSAQDVPGTRKVTINPDGSETVDGFSLFVLKFPGDYIQIVCDGSNWHIITKYLRPIVTRFTSTGTFIRTDGRRSFTVEAIGGGGAGGGVTAVSSGEAGAGVGGSAGAHVKVVLDLDDVGVFESVDIGAAGSPFSGSSGSDGGDTSFGAHLTAGGGTGGAVGTSSAGSVRKPGTNGGSFTVTNGTIILAADGDSSMASIQAGGLVTQPSRGGAGPYGGPTEAFVNDVPAAPSANTGAGGSGSASEGVTAAVAGGAASKGYLVVTEE